MKYPVVIHKNDKSCFGVTVPDFKGCFSAGDTFEEALVNVSEAIQFHIEELNVTGGLIPTPTAIGDLKNNTDFDSGIWDVIDVDILSSQIVTK
jgi:predicted RNase H-like HicB family nuclease